MPFSPPPAGSTYGPPSPFFGPPESPQGATATLAPPAPKQAPLQTPVSSPPPSVFSGEGSSIASANQSPAPVFGQPTAESVAKQKTKRDMESRQFGAALQQGAEDFTENGGLLGGMKKAQQKALVEDSQQHPEHYDATHQARYMTDWATGLADQTSKALEFMASPVDWAVKKSIGVNMGNRFVTDDGPGTHELINSVRAQAGLPSLDSKQLDPNAPSGSNEGWLTKWVGSLKGMFVDSTKAYVQAAFMPEGKAKEDAYNTASYNFIQNLADAGTFGLTKGLHEKMGLTAGNDGNWYAYGDLVRPMTKEEKTAVQASSAFGGLTGGMAVFGAMTPYVNGGVQAVAPVLKTVYAAHPYIAGAIFTNMAINGINTGINATAGRPYSATDTLNGLMTGVMFNAVGGLMGKFTPEAQGQPQDVDLEATRSLMDTTAKGLFDDLHRPPTSVELMNQLSDETIPGTDVTFAQYHTSMAQAYAENRLISFKGEGRPGIDSAAPLPEASGLPDVVVSTAKDMNVDPQQLYDAVREAGTDVGDIEAKMREYFGTKYDDLLAKRGKMVDEGGAMGLLDIADPLRKVVFAEKMVNVPKFNEEHVPLTVFEPEGMADSLRFKAMLDQGVSYDDAWSRIKGERATINAADATPNDKAAIQTAFNSLPVATELKTATKLGQPAIVAGTSFDVPKLSLEDIAADPPAKIGNLTLDPDSIRMAIDDSAGGAKRFSSGIEGDIKEPVNVLYNLDTGEYSLQNGYHRLLEQINRGGGPLQADVMFGRPDEGKFYITPQDQLISPTDSASFPRRQPTMLPSQFGEQRMPGLTGDENLRNTDDLRSEQEDITKQIQDIKDSDGDRLQIPALNKRFSALQDAIDAQIGDTPPTTPEEAQAKIDAINPKDPNAQVPQTFRTDKFQVDEEAQGKLKGVQSALGMDTRDVRHWSDVQDMAKDFGRDPVSMLKTISGNRALSDVEVQALRDTIKVASDYLGNKYDAIDQVNGNSDLTSAEKTQQIAAINTRAQQYDGIMNDAVKKLIGGGTEAGRAVAIYRNIAQEKMDDPTYWYKEAQSLIDNQSSIRVNGNKVMVQDGNIPDELKTAIDSLMDSKDQVGLSYLMSQLRGSGNIDKVIGLWKAGLLSAPTTHLAKMGSELTFRSLESVKDIPATIIDHLLSPLTGETTKTFSPLKYQALVDGFAEGGKSVPQYMATGIDPYKIATGDLNAPYETHYDNPVAEAYTQTVFHALNAETMPYKFAAFRQSLAEQAVTGVNNMSDAELDKALTDLSDVNGKPATKTDLIRFQMQKPSDDMVKQAIDDTAYQTFSKENPISQTVKYAKRLSPEMHVAADVVMPFTRFPTNMALATVDYSPLGFLKTLAGQLSDGFDQKSFSEGFGRAITGTAVMALGAKLYQDGKMTGPMPTNPAERELWDSAHKQPDSIMIGGKWHSIDRFAVLGALLTTGGIMSEATKKGGPLAGIVQTAAGGAKQLLGTTPLLGLSTALNALNDPSRNAQTWVSNAVRGLVPNILGRLAQGLDPEQRTPEKYNLQQIIESRIPILSQQVPAKQDIFGRSMPNHRGVISQLFDYTTPVKPVTDPVINELMRLQQTIPTPQQGLLTPAEHRRLIQDKGEFLYPLLQSFMVQGSPNYAGYQSLSDDYKKTAIQAMDQAAGMKAGIQSKVTAATRISGELDKLTPKEQAKRMADIQKQDQTLYQFILAKRQK